MIMEDKSVKVSCSFCGKEIECPEDMLDSEKHACFECFEKLQDELPEEEINRMHVDIPRDKIDIIAAEFLVSKLMDEVFPGFWKEGKDELKDMPRRDAVANSFIAGAKAMFDITLKMEKEENEKK